MGEPDVLSPEKAAVVRQHLETVLASHAFAGSKRTQEFLRLIVRHALDGEIDALRERMIGAELFGRPVSYDTGNDSVVRVRASEVRKKLAQYYSELGTAVVYCAVVKLAVLKNKRTIFQVALIKLLARQHRPVRKYQVHRG